MQRAMSGRKLGLLALLWLVLLGAAAAVDKPVAEAVDRTSIPEQLQGKDKLKRVARVWKEPGVYRFWIVVAGVVLVATRWDGRKWAMVMLGAGVGLHNTIIKWIVGRTRPFKLPPEDKALPFVLHPFRGGWQGLFHEQNLSFPSGHASVSFAGATVLAILFPRWRWLFFALAASICVERVLELGHWTSDTVAGAGISFFLVQWLWRAVQRSNLLVSTQTELPS